MWEGVKSTVGYLIPYEDFIIIGEQLVYLVNQDWKNFDPTKLAFASLGAATIIPIAKPLKPLLGPIKKMLDGMKKFPAAKHFAGATGTAVKSALSGNTTKIANLLPFILIAIELYEEPEVFEFMMNAIESEDDLWVWVDFISTYIEEIGGLNTEAIAQVPSLLKFIPNAHAAGGFSRKQVAARAIKLLSPLAKKIKNPKEFTKSLKVLLKEASDPANTKWKGMVKSGSGLGALSALGASKIKSFIRDSKTWRVNRWVVLMSIMYLAEQQADGKLNISNDKWLALTADVFSGWAHRRHGAMFQLSQIAYLHVKNQHAGGPEILDIEAKRPAFMLVNGEKPEKPYKRIIDIVLSDGDGGEEWIETKSLAGPFKNSWFTPTLVGKKKPKNATVNAFSSGAERGYYRQFFHDMRLNNDFINKKEIGKILDGSIGNTKYTWYFHDFKTLTASKPPTTADISMAQRRFCKVPTGVNRSDLYKYNFISNAGLMRNLCIAKKWNISKRDTKSYFKEILEDYAEELDIEDIISIAKEIGID